MLIIVILFPGIAFASTLHLSEILKKGYHFSQVPYTAFDEPESARGKDTEEYLAAILKSANEQIEKNYALVREIKVDENILKMTADSTVVVSEDRTNNYDFSKLKKCANKSTNLLKAQIFHQSLNHNELIHQTVALLGEERGVIDGLQLGIVCGLYMGIYGNLENEGPVEEIKLTSYIAKESEESVLKILKILKMQKNADSFVSIKFTSYLRSAFLVSSYKNKNVAEIDLLELKENFRKYYLSDSKEILPDGSVIEVNQISQRIELNCLFQKVIDELI